MLQFLSSAAFSKWIPISKHTRRTSSGGKTWLKVWFVNSLAPKKITRWKRTEARFTLAFVFCNNKTQLSVIKRRSQQLGITLCSGLTWLSLNEHYARSCTAPPRWLVNNRRLEDVRLMQNERASSRKSVMLRDESLEKAHRRVSTRTVWRLTGRAFLRQVTSALRCEVVRQTGALSAAGWSVLSSIRRFLYVLVVNIHNKIVLYSNWLLFSWNCKLKSGCFQHVL